MHKSCTKIFCMRHSLIEGIAWRHTSTLFGWFNVRQRKYGYIDKGCRKKFTDSRELRRANLNYDSDAIVARKMCGNSFNQRELQSVQGVEDCEVERNIANGIDRLKRVPVIALFSDIQ